MARTSSPTLRKVPRRMRLVGDFRGETLHQVQPGSPRRREVPVIAGMGGELGFHGGMGMGAIIVEDEVDGQSARDAAFNPWTQRQNRLGTIQGLDLALLIYAQHQGFLGRMQVQTHDVAQLEKELGIGAELETLDAMRLQAMRLSDAIHRRRTHPLSAGQGAHAPVRGSRRLGVQRGVHDGLFFLDLQPSPASGSRGIFQQPLQPGLLEAASPTQHRRAAGAQFPCYPVVGEPVGRTQHNADAKHDLLRRASRPRETLQQFAFFPAETQRLSSFPHAAHYTASRADCNVTYETQHQQQEKVWL